MKSLITGFILFMLIVSGAHAGHLTLAQIQILKIAILADVDPVIVAYRTQGAPYALAEYLNGPSTLDAWCQDCTAKNLFTASDITVFDNLTAGKRNAWDLLLRYSPLDFNKARNRTAVVDIWGPTSSTAILQGVVRKAFRGEAYFGGTLATTNGITATMLTVPGLLVEYDVVQALYQ